MVALTSFIDSTKAARGKGNCKSTFSSVTKSINLYKCVARVWQKLASLKYYFLSEDWDDERFKRLSIRLVSKPTFRTSLVISVQCYFNIYKFQQPEPSVHLLKPAMENLGRKLGSRILQAHVLCNHNNSVYEIGLDNNNLFKHASSIFFGMITRATLDS